MNIEVSHFSALKKKIASHEARIAVIGLGYVGLPLALTAFEAGFDTTGFDLKEDRVDQINTGGQVISYLTPDRIERAVASGKFRARTDLAALSNCDVVLICVPTPLTAEQTPDLRFVEAAAQQILDSLRPGQLVVLESTVWPGATNTMLRPILEQNGLRAGLDFFLGFSPEREDPGNDSYDTRTIPKVVGADDKASLQLIEDFYNAIVERAIPVQSSAAAEAVKLVENSFRTVNIALVNEMKVALDAMGVDVWEVIAAAATKPFGFMPFYPGPGIGGACIPVSPAYLSWRANDVGSTVPLIDLARHSNDVVPNALAERIAHGLGVSATKNQPLAGKRILLMGVAYKKDVEDTRRSPAFALLDRLEEMGAEVEFHDPYFPEIKFDPDYPHLSGRKSIELTEDSVKTYSAAVITTDHTLPDYRVLSRAARMIFDTRNVFARLGIEVDGNRLKKI